MSFYPEIEVLFCSVVGFSLANGVTYGKLTLLNRITWINIWYMQIRKHEKREREIKHVVNFELFEGTSMYVVPWPGLNDIVLNLSGCTA